TSTARQSACSHRLSRDEGKGISTPVASRDVCHAGKYGWALCGYKAFWKTGIAERLCGGGRISC
ncbi:MAG: hypothetical protein K6U00_15340, partial [Armatimonadetes bacterium]|nr:hypothetical protein [Armatimonadota bacterium]